MTVERSTAPRAAAASPLVQAGLTSIIVPSRNQKRLLSTLVDSLLASLAGHCVELIVVDNGSDDDETRQWLNALPLRLAESGFERIRVVEEPAPFNYSALNNLAAALARGDVFCFLNDDIEALDDHDWLGAMLTLARLPDVGCVGAKLIFPNDTIQHAGIMLGLGCVAGHPYKGAPRDASGQDGYLLEVQETSAVTGACLMLERAIFEQVGGLDECLPIAWNDVDLCLRVAAAGYRNLWTPEAVLLHHESASRRESGRGRLARRRHRESIEYMRAKWGAVLNSDPHLSNPPGAADRAEGASATPPFWARTVARLHGRRQLRARRTVRDSDGKA